MAKNFRHPGEVVTITSAGAVTAGNVQVLGGIVGVALNGAAGAGELVNIALTGVFELPKTGSQEWTVGARVYWTGTACTTAGNGGVPIGTAFAPVSDAAGATLGLVRLNGVGSRRAAFVANASSGSAAEINALRDALVTAGLMAPS